VSIPAEWLLVTLSCLSGDRCDTNPNTVSNPSLKNVPSDANLPQAREGMAKWMGLDGHFYMFVQTERGGEGREGKAREGKRTKKGHRRNSARMSSSNHPSRLCVSRVASALRCSSTPPFLHSCDPTQVRWSISDGWIDDSVRS
jgi:hypothetical protein